MWRKAFWILLLCASWAVATPQQMRYDDIPKVLERLFAFHIEMKQLNPVMVKRAIKIYIEQFDGEKSYLLQQEVASYLNLSDAKAQEIVERLKKGDYSDFLRLHSLFQKAVLRAQAMRAVAAQDLIEHGVDSRLGPYTSSLQYATSETELAERQRMKEERFLAFHQSRSRIETAERRAQVFALLERKLSRMEAALLMQTVSGEPLEKWKVEHQQVTKILKALAKSLDTHTTFFSPEEAYEMRLSLEKQFEGVGIVLSEGIDGVMIAEIIQGSPAEQSGQISINDLLVEIDGKNLNGHAFDEVLELLKQSRGETKLGFKRVDLNTGTEKTFQVSLRKRPISMGEARIQTSYEKFGNGIIGKISLHSFYEGADGMTSERDIKEAIRQLRQKGDLLGLVLDLRENSGGYLSQAVKVAGIFLSNGVVVISKYGQGEVHYLRNIAPRPYYGGPLVVLTSKMSASAAEIVAGALQDYGVGLVVGDKTTFGKGSIQYQTVTDLRADVFFKVTVGRYYTVSGRSTQIEGVLADIVVPSQYAPYNIGERFLEYPLSKDSVPSAFEDPLSDLEDRIQKVFQKHYLPFLQKVVSQWKRMLPQLRKNSQMRLAKNPKFQEFLQKAKIIQLRQTPSQVNSIDEPLIIGAEDLQMGEAIDVVKDMIQIEAENNPKEAASLTGTENS